MCKSILNDGFYWTGLRKDCSDAVLKCHVCQRYSVARKKYNPLTTISARMPMDYLQIDLVTGFSKTADGYVHKVCFLASCEKQDCKGSG